MKKAEFIAQVAAKSGLSKKDTEAVMDKALETITEALVKRDSVSFLGFGSFTATKKEAREITIPGTSRKVKVPAKFSVRFKPGKLLKEAVK
jgi:DNA-binding protein HU-beta